MKTWITIALLSFLVALYACNQESQQESSQAEEKVSKVEMYEPSELALLMRMMREDVEWMRQYAQKGEVPDTTIKVLDGLLNHEATNSSMRGENYDQMAHAYQAALDNYLNGDEGTNATTRFNGVVNSCISCHSQHCQGPIPGIRKLQIPQSAGY